MRIGCIRDQRCSYVKDDIKCDEVKLRNEYADQVWVELSLRNKDNLLCGCIYRSPTKERVSTIESTTKISETMTEAVQRNSSHVWRLQLPRYRLGMRICRRNLQHTTTFRYNTELPLVPTYISTYSQERRYTSTT